MRRFIGAAALICLTAGPAGAQGDLLRECAQVLPSSPNDVIGPVAARDAFRQMCVQAVNVMGRLQPGVGITFSGGNPVLGTGSTLGTRLGAIPRVSVSARASLALAEMPQLFDEYTASFGDGEVLRPMGRAGIPLGAVQADVAVGVFNGFALGFGSVDLLGSVSFVPKVDNVGLSESIMNVGGGARIGILKQGILMPGLSVSGSYRRMGTIGFGDREAHPANFESDLRNLSLRAVASKGFLILDVAVGAGYDRYSSDVDFGWRVTCATAECRAANGNLDLTLSNRLAGKLETSTWNVFANAGINFLLLHLVGELGYQKLPTGIDAKDLEDAGLPASLPIMGESLKGGNLFGSVGVRIAI